MKRIDKEILKEIRDNCMEEYGVNTPKELNLYHHIEFTDEVEKYFFDKDGFENIESMSTSNLFKTDDNGEIIDDVFDEDLVLHHNKNTLSNGWTISLLNEVQPSHSWITDGNLYYDAECLEGVEILFNLPYYKRIISSIK